jgi:hypothetical protein
MEASSVLISVAWGIIQYFFSFILGQWVDAIANGGTGKYFFYEQDA